MFPINEVLQGDCTRVLKQLPDSYVDFIVTDPPYGVHYRDRLGRTVANDDDPTRILGAFTDLYRVLKPDSVCICFYGWGLVDEFFRAWRTAGFRPIGHIVWVKNYASRERFLRYRHEQPSCLRRVARGCRHGRWMTFNHGCSRATRITRRRRTCAF